MGVGADGFVTKGYTSKPNGPRYITASPDSKYKYWSSPTESAGSTVSVTPSSISNVTPTVIYTNPTWSNKIVVQLENSYAQTTGWTVEITTDGTNWTTIATNPTYVAGRLELYRQANGTWSSTVYRDNPLQIRGMRINVTQMSKSRVFFNLIELSARLESDLSNYVIDFDCNAEMADHSFITPLGVASANTASVSLANFDNRFSNDNPSSLYYGLIDKNVEMRMDVGISTDPYTTINKTYEWIRMFTMRVDEWRGQDLDTANASLQDDSLLLQSVKPNKVLYQNMTVAEIIWRLLDSVGYTDYFVQVADADPVTMIPYFWTDGEETIWDIFKRLSQATQTAVYFDEWGVLQIKPRNSAYDLTATPVWNFDGTKVGNRLPDIESLDKSNNYEANVVNVSYSETKVSEDKQGVIPMESVWEPEGDVVLRAAALTFSMTANQMYFRIDPAVAKTWPFAGVIQVEGEFIRFTTKHYYYYAANGTLQGKYLKSEAERVALDTLNPSLAFKNAYSGYFGVSVRGEYNSSPKAHVIDATGYFTRIRTGAGAVTNNPAGFRALSGTSNARISTNKTFKSNTWYTITRGSDFDVPPNYYGTRIRFPTTGYNDGIAGLCVGNSTNESGYFIELYSTPLFSKFPSARNTTNEVALYVKDSSAVVKRFGPNGGKGAVAPIVRGVWYDIDIYVNWNYSGGPMFEVYLNGVRYLAVQVPNASKPSASISGRWGVFTRGFTNVDVEYIYASSSNEVVSFDGATQYSRIHGGYLSNQLATEWIYNSHKVNRMIGKKKTSVIQRYNQLFIDDFGPVAHETRELNVKFDPNPVLHSRLYWSNTDQVVCPEYNSDAFGAKFILSNATRQNAIVNGTDKATFGADNSVEQKLLIYGRVVKQEEEKKETVRNEAAILRRGEVTVDFPADWIQSQAEAKELGEWITKHWAGGQDEITIDSFMNPLLQVGDVVSVNHPAGNMATATHKYFVVEIKHTYETGLESSFTLRRARI
jgi:hypothetical protein